MKDDNIVQMKLRRTMLSKTESTIVDYHWLILYYGICILFSFLIVDKIIVQGDLVSCVVLQDCIGTGHDNKIFSYIVVCKKISAHTSHFLSKLNSPQGNKSNLNRQLDADAEIMISTFSRPSN